MGAADRGAIATAFTGVIGFVGLIVPQILPGGADNRYLIPASALLGGTLLTLAAPPRCQP